LFDESVRGRHAERVFLVELVAAAAAQRGANLVYGSIQLAWISLGDDKVIHGSRKHLMVRLVGHQDGTILGVSAHGALFFLVEDADDLEVMSRHLEHLADGI